MLSLGTREVDHSMSLPRRGLLIVIVMATEVIQYSAPCLCHASVLRLNRRLHSVPNSQILEDVSATIELHRQH